MDGDNKVTRLATERKYSGAWLVVAFLAQLVVALRPFQFSELPPRSNAEKITKHHREIEGQNGREECAGNEGPRGPRQPFELEELQKSGRPERRDSPRV